jgi:beta-lactamase class A
MLKRKVSLTVCLGLLIVSNLVIYFWVSNQKLNDFDEDAAYAEANSSDLAINQNATCTYNIARLNGYRFIRPLIFAEPSCETESMHSVRKALENHIQSLKETGRIKNASVYVRLFQRGEWISIEDREKYSPGSLLKVPELITIMKMKEKDPDILNKKLLFDQPVETHKTATFVTKGIELGKSYTVRELLYYMIAHSDNNATYLLNRFMDFATFKKVFTDLGLAEPDMTSSEYNISARDFSVFMKVLYNASYLSIQDSEFCTELLSKCDFTKGLVSGIPDDCTIAHKFGEGGDASTQTFNLSESGLVYCKDKTYLVTIMTKGSDMKALAPIISDISKLVHKELDSYFKSKVKEG